MPHLHPPFALRSQRRPRPFRSAADWRRMATPWCFYALAGRLVRWLGAVAVLGAGATVLASHAGTDGGLVLLHGVTGTLAIALYLSMALAAGLGLFGVARLCPIVAAAAAPTTALMALIAVASRAALAAAGRADAGWSASLAPEALLLPLALGVLLLQHALADTRRADRAAAVLALAGVPPLAVMVLGAPPAAGLSAALVLGLVAAGAHAGAVVLQRTRLETVERARRQLDLMERL